MNKYNIGYCIYEFLPHAFTLVEIINNGSVHPAFCIISKDNI